MTSLILALALLLLGPLLYGIAGKSERLITQVNFLTVVGVAGLILFLVLPHLYEHVGWLIAIPVVIGFAGPYLFEQFLRGGHEEVHKAILMIVLIGLGLHAFLDGMALNLSSRHAESDPTDHLPLALVIHRAADGLALWKVLKEDRWKAWGALVMIACTTVMGYSVGELIAHDPHGTALAYFEAFVAGTLLHIVLHSHHHE